MFAFKLYTRANYTQDKEKPRENSTFTIKQLSQYDGTDTTLPILLAARGYVYDVSSSPQFYGRGGGYHLFAGRDASRALALSSLDSSLIPSEFDDLEDLSEESIETLKNWVNKFDTKYKCVGRLIKDL